DRHALRRRRRRPAGDHPVLGPAAAGRRRLDDRCLEAVERRPRRPALTHRVRTRPTPPALLPTENLLDELGSKLDTATVREWRAGLLEAGVSATMVAKSYRLLPAILNTAVT